MMDIREHVSVIIPIFNFLLLVSLVLISRKWTGPVQDVRIQAIEDEQKLIRGNIRRLERDLQEALHHNVSSNEQILRELEAIRSNGAQERPLEDKLQQMESTLFELERTIAAMPCAYHASVAANGKKDCP